MKSRFRQRSIMLAFVVGIGALLSQAPVTPADEAPAKPYKVLTTTQIPALGGIDYVNADSVNRRVYVACGSAVSIFDLDTYKLTGTLEKATGRGVAIDPENHTGLVTGNPATFFNTKKLEVITTIPAPGADGYVFDAPTHRFFVLSHRAPNILVVDSKDGKVVGKIEALGPKGANASVEQGVSDGEGRLFFDIANEHHIAVVDAKTLKVTGHYDLGEKGKAPAGLAIDTKNHILFAMCRGGSGGTPTCVILSSIDGKIITTLPLAGSSDGAVFNPRTMEAFSSHGNGTLSVIKEKSPTEFVIQETVKTKTGAKTCTLDTKTDRVIVITREPAPEPGPDAGKKGGRAMLLDVMFIGR